jgi:hypothetical protein
MSLPTITIDDFTGVNKISADIYAQVDFDAYIEQSTIKYIGQILGQEALLYIKDTGTLFAKYNDLIDGVAYDNTKINSDRTVQVEWFGLKSILVPLIYFDYVRDNFINTNTGNVRNRNENSEIVGNTYNSMIALGRYNNGVGNQPGLTAFLENYNRLTKPIDSFDDLGGGNYRINTSTTFYLNNGDIITYGGVEYVVSNVQLNASFEISGETGLTFSGEFQHEPFFKVNYCPLSYAIG